MAVVVFMHACALHAYNAYNSVNMNIFVSGHRAQSIPATELK